MMKLFSVKKQKVEGRGDGKSIASNKIVSSALLRIQKDFQDLNLPRTCQMELPNPNELLNFKLILIPDEGFYKGGKFVFSFKIPPGYPIEAPKVKCETMIYHPNIDLQGNICLNILREDWKPVLNLHSVIIGIQFLFLEPNAEDPLNESAAQVLKSNRRMFEQNIFKSMRGGYIGNVYFERCLVR